MPAHAGLDVLQQLVYSNIMVSWLGLYVVACILFVAAVVENALYALHERDVRPLTLGFMSVPELTAVSEERLSVLHCTRRMLKAYQSAGVALAVCDGQR